MDADNIFCAPAGWHWPELTADAYEIGHRSAGTDYNMCILVSDRLRWRYVGVLHEYITSDTPHGSAVLTGAWIDRRHEGDRSRDPQTYRKDAAILERALAADPTNARYAFYLAQSWRDAGEIDKARDAYRRRAAMAGWDEETWYSFYQIAVLNERLGAPPAEVQLAYLDAYQYRPRRAEPLVQLARWHRLRNEWALARLYARAAQAIARPDDKLFLDEATYRWAADDEAAIAAYWTGEMQECFRLSWALLDDDRLPENQRPRVESNRDFAAASIATMTGAYPGVIVQRLAHRPQRAPAGQRVTLTVTCGRRLDLFERTINSFLNCCRDIDLVGRFVCIDDNSSLRDRERMRSLYPFFEFIFKSDEEKGHAKSMNRLLDIVATPYWLHLEDDWHFIVTTDYVARAMTMLEAEPDVAQVQFNRNFAETLGDRILVGGVLRRLAGSAVRYLIHEHVPEGAARDEFRRRFPPDALSNAWRPHFAIRPSLMRTDAVRAVGRFDESGPAFEQEFAVCYTAAGLRSAFFDTVTCMHTGHAGANSDSAKPSVHSPNAVWQWQ